MAYLKTTLLAVCFLLLRAGVAAQTKDEADIRQLMAEQVTAWNKGDVAGFMQGYWQNDSLMFIGKNGPEYGWQNVLDNYKKSYPGKEAMGTLDFNILEVRKLSPEYSFVIGKWHIAKQQGDFRGNFTLLFRRINKKWLIVMDHSDG